MNSCLPTGRHSIRCVPIYHKLVSVKGAVISYNILNIYNMKWFYILLVIFLAGIILSSSKKEKEKADNRSPILFCAPGFDPTAMNSDAPLLKDLVKINYKVTTRSENAQQYFNQGLALIYGFNHGEAGRSFK